MEDRTPQIIDNLAETAVNVAQFLSALDGLSVPTLVAGTGVPAAGAPAAVAQAAVAPPASDDPVVAALQKQAGVLCQTVGDLVPKIKSISVYELKFDSETPYVKHLNVDQTFDPLVDEQRLNFEKLFWDAQKPGNAAPGIPDVYSPLKLKVCIRTGRGTEDRRAGPRSDGLWFRELRGIQIKVTINDGLLAKLQEDLKDARESIKVIQCESRKAGDGFPDLNRRAIATLAELKSLGDIRDKGYHRGGSWQTGLR